MALLHPLFDMLPKVIVDEIFSYDPLHREYMKEVFEELKKKHDSRYRCSRYDCQSNCYDKKCIQLFILVGKYSFCCRYCARKGSRKIREDLRRYDPRVCPLVFPKATF